MNSSRIKNGVSIILYNLLCFLCVIRTGLQYYINDDFYMGLIANGVYGRKYSCHLVFSNWVLGWILTIVNRFISNRNTYMLFQYVLFFIAIVIFFIMMSYKYELVTTLIVNTVFWIIELNKSISSLTWTKTAYFCAIVAIVLLGYSINHKLNKVLNILAATLLVFAYMYRAEAMFVIVAIGSFYLLSELIIANKKDRLKFYKKILVICASIGLLLLINDHAYSSQIWKEYSKYNSIRSELVDFKIPSYDLYAEEYSKIGFTSNDVKMLENWNFGDTDKYSIENLEKISSFNSSKNNDIVSRIKYSIIVTVSSLKGKITFWLSIIVYIIALIITKSKSKKICLVGLLVLTGSFEFYLAWIGRLIERVEYGLILALMIFSLSMISCKKKELSNNWKNGCCVIVMLFAFFIVSNHNLEVNNRDYNYLALTKYFQNNTENRYVMDTASVGAGFYTAFSPFDIIKNQDFENNFLLGSWMTYSPFYNDYLGKMEITNPISELKTDPNYYYVTRDTESAEIVLQYIKENYYPDCEYDIVDEEGDFKIIKYK